MNSLTKPAQARLPTAKQENQEIVRAAEAQWVPLTIIVFLNAKE